MLGVASQLPRPTSAPPQSEAAGWAALASAMAADERGLGTVRAWSSARRLVASLVIGAAVPLAVALVARRVDFPHLSMVRWWLGIAALLAVVVAGSTLAMRPLQRRREPSWVAWIGLGGAAITIALALVPQAHHAHPGSFIGDGEELLPYATGCLVFGTLCALPTWLGLRMLARDGDRLGMHAGFIAAVAAAVGATAVMVHCPIVHGPHLLLGHATVLVLPWIWAMWVARR
jgi:hypothetical protein